MRRSRRLLFLLPALVLPATVSTTSAGRDVVRMPWTRKHVPSGRYLLTVVLQSGRSTLVQRDVVTVSR